MLLMEKNDLKKPSKACLDAAYIGFIVKI